MFTRAEDKIRLFCLVLTGVFLCCPLGAEIVMLRSGESVEGPLIESTDKYIKINMDGSPMTFYYDEIRIIKNRSGLSTRLEDTRLVAGTISVPINPLVSFDRKSKKAILDLRRKAVASIPALAPDGYEPRANVFEGMMDGLPWWGSLGGSSYGQGDQNILGPSKESRFILNPYLLVGLEDPEQRFGRHGGVDFPGMAREALLSKDSPAAGQNNSLPAESAGTGPGDIVLDPVRLTWEQGGRWAQVRYEISASYRDFPSAPFFQNRQVTLSYYNARDFGYNYWAIDGALSRNILTSFGNVNPVDQFIGLDMNCGVSIGCNTRLPFSTNEPIQWNILPARIHIKLWKEFPMGVLQPEDMAVIIDLV
jgi:hypothetical protein